MPMDPAYLSLVNDLVEAATRRGTAIARCHRYHDEGGPNLIKAEDDEEKYFQQVRALRELLLTEIRRMV